MPTYEFRCRSCGATFTEQRPMAQSSDPAWCPDGHDDTVKLLNVAGTLSSSGSTQLASRMESGGGSSGGCCGGGCCSN